MHLRVAVHLVLLLLHLLWHTYSGYTYSGYTYTHTSHLRVAVHLVLLLLCPRARKLARPQPRGRNHLG